APGTGGGVPAPTGPVRAPVRHEPASGHRGRLAAHGRCEPRRVRVGGVMNRPFAITLGVGSSLANKTGAWRTQLPVFVSRKRPGATACPAGQDPQKWLYATESAGYETAWRLIMDVNPFPAVIGRVCYHPCQTACNRATVDEAVGINAVER